MTPLRLLWSQALALGWLATALWAAGPVAAQPEAPPQEVETAEPAGPSPMDAAPELPEAFSGMGVTEQLGTTVPRDVRFTDSRGESVRFGDVLDGTRPVVLVFAYHSCPMLCSLVLDGATNALRETGLEMGEDYRAVVVSFDPEDTPERAAAVKSRYAAFFPDADTEDGLRFLVGDEAEIAALTDAVGFGFKWVPERQEYGHNATLIFLSPSGLVTRYLYGIEHPAPDVRKALLEAGEGTIGSPVDQLLLYCFVYDPAAGGYVLHAQNAMKLGGLVTLIILGLFLAGLWFREKAKNDAARHGPPAGIELLRPATGP